MARTHARFQREHDRVNKAVEARRRAEAAQAAKAPQVEKAPQASENGHGLNGHAAAPADPSLTLPGKPKKKKPAILPAQAPVETDTDNENTTPAPPEA
jgi:hypothetical protein